MPHDVIAFGEAMIRLSPPHFQRLEQARSLDVEVGGAELNTAVGLVRLGRSAAWASRLPDNPLGQLVANRVREGGVSDEFVQFTDDGRCGVYFLEFGAAPRASNIVYDRKDSSIARVPPGAFDWPTVFRGAKWFHVTGITPALGPGAAAATADALKAAKAAGVRVSIDLNYRAKLWTREEAGRTMAGLLTGADLLIASEADAEHLFGVTGADFADVAKKLTDRFGLGVVAGVRRETPLVWRNRFSAVGYAGGTVFETRWYEVEIVDRLGAGELRWRLGLIHGLLDGDFQSGLDYGTAMGALKHTIPGDFAWFTRDEVEDAMRGQGLRIRGGEPMTDFYLSRDQVRELDRRAIDGFGVPGVVLMENAGRGCAELLTRLNPERKPVVILCGPGNNGGDGFVIARHLDNHGWPVDVHVVARSKNEPGDADVNFDILYAAGVPFTQYHPNHFDQPQADFFRHRGLSRAGWVVDALFGTGLSRSLGPPYDSLVGAVNESGHPVLAVDIPSGLDCDTGEPLGPTVRATHTATFVAPKLGFRNPASKAWTGDVHVIDIGAPRTLVDEYRTRRTG